ncbi:MAG: hypothetical protein AAF721_07635 [Myxococcota bacterium]
MTALSPPVRLAPTLSCLALSTACVVQPLNGDVIADAAAPVTFSGYWTQGNNPMEIQSAPSSSGPWTTFANATSDAVGFPIDGIMLHGWSVSAVIPGWTPSGCGQEVYVRASGGVFSALTFDGPGAGAPVTGSQCLSDELGAGTDIVNAAITCASPDSPVMHLTEAAGPSTHVGDVVITTQAEADALACTTEIDGSLTIADSAELSIALPDLQSVTGDVTLVFSRDPASLSTNPIVRTIDAPQLDTIAGSLAVSYPGIGGDLVDLDIGLPALTTLGADLSIDLTTFNADMGGLTALATIPGDLSIISTGSDYTHGGLLGALVDVGGNVTFETSNTTTGLLDDLTQVGGTISITGAFFPPGAPNLTELLTVGGDLQLASMDLITVVGFDNQFPLLTDVGGDLDIEQGGLDDLLVGDPLGITVGGVRLHDNGSLSGLNAPNVTVSTSGPITITDNGNLGDCNAQAFVDDQAALGWAGVATVSGNGTC